MLKFNFLSINETENVRISKGFLSFSFMVLKEIFDMYIWRQAFILCASFPCQISLAQQFLLLCRNSEKNEKQYRLIEQAALSEFEDEHCFYFGVCGYKHKHGQNRAYGSFPNLMVVHLVAMEYNRVISSYVG